MLRETSSPSPQSKQRSAITRGPHVKPGQFDLPPMLAPHPRRAITARAGSEHWRPSSMITRDPHLARADRAAIPRQSAPLLLRRDSLELRPAARSPHRSAGRRSTGLPAAHSTWQPEPTPMLTPHEPVRTEHHGCTITGARTADHRSTHPRLHSSKSRSSREKRRDQEARRRPQAVARSALQADRPPPIPARSQPNAL